MTSEQAYLKFIQKVNKNFTNDNLEVDKGRFVLMYNEVQNKFVEWVLEKRNEDEIRDIQQLFEKGKKLEEVEKDLDSRNFKLPENYFAFSNLKVYGSKGSCTKELLPFEIKSENKHEILFDENNKPSFMFEEVPYQLGGNNVIIYVDDFEIKNAYLNYYRYPVQIDIEGYINTEGNVSVTVNPELQDRIVDRILSAAAKEFDLNSENLQKFQFDKDRVFSKI